MSPIFAKLFALFGVKNYSPHHVCLKLAQLKKKPNFSLIRSDGIIETISVFISHSVSIRGSQGHGIDELHADRLVPVHVDQ